MGSFRNARPVVFYRSDNGREPVREWLQSLSKEDRKRIGRDILTLQLGWPSGMPIARKLEPGLWEVRTRLDHAIARVVFTDSDGSFILLHGFVKKTRKTPLGALRVARQRLEQL